MKKVTYLVAIVVTAVCVFSCRQRGENNSQSKSGIDTVIISLMQFHPDTVYISKGDTVVWVNHDLVKHYVAAFPDKQWGSGTILTDSTWSTVINKDWEYFCYIHPTMKGKIIIE